MSVNLNNLSNANQTQPITGINAISSRAPSGLSSAPSRLEGSSVNRSDCLGCFRSLFNKCLNFFKGLFPRFFPTEVTIPIPEGPISAAILEGRIAKGREYLQNQLRTRVEDNPQTGENWSSRGLEPAVINDSKVIVILKYNDKIEVCHQQLQGADSLELLRQAALNKMDTLFRDPANAGAHRTILSVNTLAYVGPRTIPYLWQQTRLVGRVFFASSEQEKYVTLNPDNSIDYPRGGHDSNSSGVRNREETTVYLRNKIPGLPEIHTELGNFLFN